MTTVTIPREVLENLLNHWGIEPHTNMFADLRAALDAPDKPESCPYCADSHTLGAVYFDQNCAGCVKRMAPAKPVDCKGCAELLNIADAKRLNREMFRDDTEWADWAQLRARHASITKVPK